MIVVSAVCVRAKKTVRYSLDVRHIKENINFEFSLRIYFEYYNHMYLLYLVCDRRFQVSFYYS